MVFGTRRLVQVVAHREPDGAAIGGGRGRHRRCRKPYRNWTWSSRHTLIAMRRAVKAPALKERRSTDIDSRRVVSRNGQAAEDDAMKTGTGVEFDFELGPLTLADVQRRAGDMWSDLAFDEAALARVKRDGLMLDGVRLTGQSPFVLAEAGDGQLRVSIDPAVAHWDHVETLLDLWRVHFVRGLRQGSLAA